jgi:glycine cleavage system H protein
VDSRLRGNDDAAPFFEHINLPRSPSMTTMYTPDHEWINIEDHEAATVGITLHAQDALGDVVFVDLPEADIYMPVSGEVVEVNEALRADPSLANSDPLGNGWFFKVKVSDMAEFEGLLDAPAYDALVKNA